MRFQPYWDASLPQYIEDLRLLVNQDSGSYDREDVAACAGLFSKLLSQRAGMDTEVLPHDVSGPMVIGRKTGRGRGRLLLIGHLDTVFGRGTAAKRPFSVRGDFAYGPGVADMKGGIVLGIHSLKALFDGGFDAFREIVFCANPDEEIGSPSSRDQIARRAKGADAALVLEGGRGIDTVVTSRKGVGSFTITARGKASHAGAAPDEGRSAILELANKILFLEQQQRLSPGLRFNVGRISGGARANIVPPEASMEVDVRVQDAHEIMLAQEILKKCSAHSIIQGVHLDISGSFEMPPMEMTAGSKALFDVAQSVAKEEGFTLRGVATGGGSDGNRVSGAGIPVLDGLGPVGSNGHRDDECLDLSSVPARGSFLSALIERVLRRAG